jgi:hypothetical protein
VKLGGEIARAKGGGFWEVSQAFGKSAKNVFDPKLFLANVGAGKAIFQIP